MTARVHAPKGDRPMSGKAETQSLTMEFNLAHPPAKVWRALTERDLLTKWLMPNDMQPVLGHAFTFKVDMKPSPRWDGIVHCEVQEIEPYKRLRYSWRAGSLDTVVTWTLQETPSGGTVLRLEQSGFRLGDGQTVFFEGAKNGWQTMAGQRLVDALAHLA
jgi:uncharacterized protein YndB with AHSA1/START domain